jgi:hypothetical protein
LRRIILKKLCGSQCGTDVLRSIIFKKL